MKNTVKGVLLTGGVLLIVGCSTTHPAPHLTNNVQPMVMRSFALNPVPDFALEPPVCRRDESLFSDCGMESRSTTRSMLAEGMRENMMDNLSERLVSGLAGDSHKKNRNTNWRVKPNRLEWQYKF